MLKHHDADLDRALDHLGLEGSVTIRWDHLYNWFDAARLGKGAYREILRRWEELCTKTWGYASAPKLSLLSTYSSMTIFRDVFKEEDEEIVPFESQT